MWAVLIADMQIKTKKQKEMPDLEKSLTFTVEHKTQIKGVNKYTCNGV